MSPWSSNDAILVTDSATTTDYNDKLRKPMIFGALILPQYDRRSELTYQTRKESHACLLYTTTFDSFIIRAQLRPQIIYVKTKGCNYNLWAVVKDRWLPWVQRNGSVWVSGRNVVIVILYLMWRNKFSKWVTNVKLVLFYCVTEYKSEDWILLPKWACCRYTFTRECLMTLTFSAQWNIRAWCSLTILKCS